VGAVFLFKHTAKKSELSVGGLNPRNSPLGTPVNSNPPLAPPLFSSPQDKDTRGYSHCCKSVCMPD